MTAAPRELRPRVGVIGADPTAAIVEQLGEAGDAAEDATLLPFARAVLRRVAPEQLAAADPNAMAAAVAAAHRFARDRPPGEIRVQVEDPVFTVHGGKPRGSVVEVACEERPFVVTTVLEELRHRGYEVVRTLHAAFGTTRDDRGRLVGTGPARGADRSDAFLAVELGRTLEATRRGHLVDGLQAALADLVVVSEAFDEMRARTMAAAEHVAGEDPEAAALLRWLLDGNLVLLGCRDTTASEPQLGLVPDGVSPSQSEGVDVSRTGARSTVHVRAPIQRYAAGGLELFGFFTRKGQTAAPAEIPVVRRKLAEILEREDAIEGSHDEQVLTGLFQSLPRDELFERPVEALHATLTELRAAETEHEVRVLLRAEPGGHTVSALLTLPRDRYDPALRQRVERFLLSQLDGASCDVDVMLGARAEAVMRFVVDLGEAPAPVEPLSSLEREVRLLCRTWAQQVTAALAERRDVVAARYLVTTWADRFPATYRENVTAVEAADDIEQLEALVSGDQAVRVVVVRDPARPEGARVKLYARGIDVELSRFLPILESLGLWVIAGVPHQLSGDLQLHDFRVDDPTATLDPARDSHRMAAAAVALWDGRAEIDSLNRLVLRAGLAWGDVAVLRAYRRYRTLVGTAYSAEYVHDVLVEHPDVARALVAEFRARFVPDGSDARDATPAAGAIQAALEGVDRFDHDRILRGMAALIDATVATNRGRTEVGDRISLKFDGRRVPDSPPPVPYREIFVSTPVVEGVHLRAGPVARGGLRWSDRLDDFRTEVHDLMRAQILKNALIVPVGAKGGFVVKRRTTGTPLPEAVRSAYETFVSGLLDVTDDVDGEDPYLVVAADRGTATFSDVANHIAEERDFWLGDAFASGGSRGYDHKALGITAKGAWVAVGRHFRELDIDVQTEPITVVGIGDMSGDVFGNAMLCSDRIKLIAAFDHRDVFVDPDPDAAHSYAERQRLFEAGRSSWQDYDRSVLSRGGGVWSRHEKRIALSAEARSALGVDAQHLSPPELIRAILSARVDLLLAGGIGTFVRASTEPDVEIDDRANSELRVVARDIRARVVVEGANLAFTQQARVEYARRGGRINCDFVDNAAGVAISDREVNLKILLRGLAARDQLLAEVTDDVVAAVLGDVGRQASAVGHHTAASVGRLDAYEALITRLEEQEVLDRTVERLPSAEELTARTDAGAGLTRPETAVMLAGTKRALASAIVASDLPEDPALRSLLEGYFPRRLVARHADRVSAHRLHREIIAAALANDLVDRMGPTFLFRTAEDTGATVPDVAAAYWTARQVAGADQFWRYLRSAEDQVPADELLGLYTDVAALLESLCRSYLRQRPTLDLEQVVADDHATFDVLVRELPALGSSERRRTRSHRAEAFTEAGVEPAWAVRFACLPELHLVPDIADVARTTHRPVLAVAGAFAQMGDALGLDRLVALLDTIEPHDAWARSARQGLLDDLGELRRHAASRALTAVPDADPADAVERFLAERHSDVADTLRVVRELEASEGDRLDAVAVAARAARRAVDRAVSN